MVYYVCKYFLSCEKSFVDNEIVMKNIHTISIRYDPFNYEKNHCINGMLYEKLNKLES